MIVVRAVVDECGEIIVGNPAVELVLFATSSHDANHTCGSVNALILSDRSLSARATNAVVRMRRVDARHQTANV